MKKLYLFTLLPALLMASCNGQEVVKEARRVEISHDLGLVSVTDKSSDSGEVTGNHITYLMMSKYGRLNIGGTTIAGSDVPEKYYENCIIWKSTSTGNLPTNEEVFNKDSNVTFRGWAKYNDNVYPEYLTTVPSVSGECVYAIFDGPAGSGGGGGPTVDSYNVTIEVDLGLFDGWEGISNFSVYLWGANMEEPLGNWAACENNLKGTSNIKSVSASDLNYSIVGAIFYFDQEGGEYPGRKQTTDMKINISSSGTYRIAPTSDYIAWDSEGKMSNFTISKVS